MGTSAADGVPIISPRSCTWEKKKFAGSSMLSEALRRVSMTDFSACWPCLCQAVHPQPLHVLKFFSTKECQAEASVGWGLVALNCQRTKEISRGC